MLPFECRGLMDPKKLKPVFIDIKGKNKVIDGLEDPNCFFKYYTYEPEKNNFYVKEYFEKYIKLNVN